jgi:hypothetical protein
VSDRRKEDAGEESREPAGISTLAPARNFTIPLASRVLAAAGPPAYCVRKRRIEDLEAQIVDAIQEAVLLAPDLADARRTLANRRTIERQLRQLAELIVAHNRYYPVEAKLPLDPRTGQLLERGAPWKPLPLPTFDALFARATESGREGGKRGTGG